MTTDPYIGHSMDNRGTIGLKLSEMIVLQQSDYFPLRPYDGTIILNRPDTHPRDMDSPHSVCCMAD